MSPTKTEDGNLQQRGKKGLAVCIDETSHPVLKNTNACQLKESRAKEVASKG